MPNSHTKPSLGSATYIQEYPKEKGEGKGKFKNIAAICPIALSFSYKILFVFKISNGTKGRDYFIYHMEVHFFFK